MTPSPHRGPFVRPSTMPAASFSVCGSHDRSRCSLAPLSQRPEPTTVRSGANAHPSNRRLAGPPGQRHSPAARDPARGPGIVSRAVARSGSSASDLRVVMTIRPDSSDRCSCPDTLWCTGVIQWDGRMTSGAAGVACGVDQRGGSASRGCWPSPWKAGREYSPDSLCTMTVGGLLRGR